MFGPFGAIAAAKGQFEKKFKDKTGQAWSKTIRDNFVPRSNKYTLLEMEYDDDVPEGPIVVGDKKVTVRPSKLDPVVQEFVKLISDSDMFKQQMQAKGIDVHRMPLGKLSQSTVKKGLEALNSISRVLKGEEKGDVKDLSSVFYTNIPHAHGRGSALPTITAETLQQKIDLVNMLGDIAIAQSLLSGADAKTTGDEVDHPTDVHYKALNADLTSVKPGSSEFDYIKTYMDNTQPGHLKLLEVLKVNRHPEGDRYKEHDDLDNRKLLWHGTNVAVVVAILKSGLRIMPHSGGRVGRGIYLADENSKSAGYVGRTSDGIGMMFLCEAVLGKEHHINRDDSSLRAAPKGFDSVIAKGWKMPNPKDDIEVDFDGRKVTVPQGKSTNTEYSGNSSFSQNEYLVYRESQVRIRYVLKIQWPKGNAWY
jgi:poly [ADP-ribose] polymerase